MMENLKIKVNSEAKSKEAQELFFKLGYDWVYTNMIRVNIGAIYADRNGDLTVKPVSGIRDYKEVTLQELRDKVVLKRNNVDDATHTCNGQKYYLTASEFFEYINGHWENVDEFVDGCVFEPIQESKMTTLKQMENLKIRVHTEQQVKTVIELAEKLGYKEKYPKSFNLTDGYVCLYDDKDIFKVCISQAGSELNEFKEISMTDLYLMTTPQYKEYLDPHNNYELIEWDGGFMIQDHWIEVPEGAEVAVKPKSCHVVYFFNGKSYFSDIFTPSKWVSLQCDYKGYMDDIDSDVVWQRHAQPEALPFIDDESTAWDKQVGGNHYKQFKIQPMQFALENKLDAAQHNVIKYVMRHALKNGKEDLEKAKHYIDLMIEHYYGDL